ncbi:MAG: DUF948 domain-containing protein [Candidatus Methylomirabilaceae bacterium]
MLSTPLALWSLVVLLVVLVCGMIPAFVQIRRTALQAEVFLKVAELELRPALIELKEIIRNLNRVSEQVTGGIDKVGGALEAIKETGETIGIANDLVQQILFPKLITGAAFMTGLRAGLRTLIARLIKGR